MLGVGESDGGREEGGAMEGRRVMELTHLGSSSPTSIHRCAHHHPHPFTFIHGCPFSLVDSHLHSWRLSWEVVAIRGGSCHGPWGVVVVCGHLTFVGGLWSSVGTGCSSVGSRGH